jgi:Tfp pilus assembly protein PilW
MKKTITLVELILAMSLLGVIVFAATSIDITARRFFRASDLTAEVVNEASYVMEHIQKHASQAHGWRDAAGYTGWGPEPLAASNTLQIVIDADEDPATNTIPPDVLATYVLAGNEARFQTNLMPQPEVLSYKIIQLQFDSIANNSAVRVTVRARHDPTNPTIDPKTNPEETLATNIFFGQHSTN